VYFWDPFEFNPILWKIVNKLQSQVRVSREGFYKGFSTKSANVRQQQNFRFSSWEVKRWKEMKTLLALKPQKNRYEGILKGFYDDSQENQRRESRESSKNWLNPLNLARRWCSTSKKFQSHSPKRQLFLWTYVESRIRSSFESYKSQKG
jgi:hypothetical protein